MLYEVITVDGQLVSELSRLASKRNKPLEVHIKLDAGMGRQGILPKDFTELVQTIQHADSIHLAGVMAHFPMADA